MFLTQDEIADLTGYERAHCQCAWLDANSVAYKKRRNGSPVVLRLELERAMSPESHTISNDEERPDFSALQAYG